MQLRRFRGRALPEVVRRVREELGPEAVIVHTRAARPPRLLRFIRGSAVEVLAAVDRPGAPPARRPEPARPAPAWSRPAPAGLEAELGELRRLLLRVGGAGALPPALAPFYPRLLAAGLDERLAFRLLDDFAAAHPAPAGEPAALEAALRAWLARAVPAAAPPSLGPGVVAVVGPAGSGKTALVAGLAVHAHLAGTRTALVSLDGVGVAGTAALQALAGALAAPCTLALGPEAVAAAAGASGQALVLVDTPGLGFRDAPGLAALGPLLAAARPREVHLVLPATTKREDLLAAIRAFGPLAPTHLAFTRLDETCTWGAVLAAAVEGGRGLSYLVAGRELPGDVRPAGAGEVAGRVLDGDHPA